MSQKPTNVVQQIRKATRKRFSPDEKIRIVLEGLRGQIPISELCRVEQNGIRGCWEYWKKTLNEEAADFTMELDEDKGEFRIAMHNCPSKGRLLEYKHIEPYGDYCEHCDLLYRRVLEPLGFEYSIDLSQSDEAYCTLVVRRKD